MEKTTIFLVRHGIKEKAIGDVPITPEGVVQAQLTGQHLNGLSITAIVSSPLRRAVETAQYIAAAQNIPVSIDDRLRERANWGDLPGQTFDEFIDMWEKCIREPDFIPPAGDSVRQACARLSSLLSELVQQYPSGSHIVVVTHGGLITDYLVHTFAENDLNRFHPNFIEKQSSLIPECSITELNYENDRFTLAGFASVDHFSN